MSIRKSPLWLKRMPLAVVIGALALAIAPAAVYAYGFEWSRPATAVIGNSDWMPLAADNTGEYYITRDEQHLAKYGFDGSPLWDHALPVIDGGVSVASMAADDTGVYLAGLVSGHWPGEEQPTDPHEAFVARFTSDGELVWARQFRMPDSPSDFSDERVALAPGAVYLAQVWIHREGMLAKVDRDGTVRWRNDVTFGGELASLAADSDGAVVATIGGGLQAFSATGAARWSATDAEAESVWDVAAAPGGGTYVLFSTHSGGLDRIKVKRYGVGGSAGIAHQVASQTFAEPTGMGVLGDRLFVSWYSGLHGTADRQGWASLNSGLGVVWSRSHTLPSDYGYVEFAVSARGGFLADGGTLAKVTIDDDPPFARWEDYVLPSKLPFHDDLVTGLAKWTGGDKLSGIDHFDLQQSENGGAWSKVSLKDGAATSALIDEKPGAAYKFRVRAVDMSGNVGAWNVSPAYALSLIQDNSNLISFDSAWSSEQQADSSGGSVMSSSKAGSVAQYEFKGDGFGFVTIVGPDRGKVAVYVDGKKVTTLDLYAKAETAQYVPFTRLWRNVDTHTIKLVVQGTAGRPRVDVDAFEIRSTQ